MNIQRKKLAFIKSIREQHLNNYFTSRRQQIEEQSSKLHQILSKVYSLFDDLPHKIIELAQQLDQNFQAVCPFLTKEVKQFCNRMIGSQNVEWCYFVYAINRLLVSPLNDKNGIRKIVNESFLPILDGVQIQLKKASNSIMESKILNCLLQYCFRLGGYIQTMHQLQQNAMVNTMNRLWDYKWESEQQLQLLQTSLKVFNINFDKEDEQNITKEQWRDAEITRIKLIKLVFYEQQSQYRLAHILHRMMNLIFESNSQLLNLYLRLLVTFTKYTWSAIYIYPLLKFNIIHIISSIIYTHQNYDKLTLIFTLRLLNNLLMNDTQLTSQISQEFMISNVIKLFHQIPSQQIQSEIAELLINLTLFMNDQSEFIRTLIYLGATEIMIEVLKIFSQQKEDVLLQQAVSCINVMLNHNSIQVKKTVRCNQKLLKKILEEQINISSMLENILQSCQIQEIAL